jgi:hypothetical protein
MRGGRAGTTSGTEAAASGGNGVTTGGPPGGGVATGAVWQAVRKTATRPRAQAARRKPRGVDMAEF